MFHIFVVLVLGMAQLEVSKRRGYGYRSVAAGMARQIPCPLVYIHMCTFSDPADHFPIPHAHVFVFLTRRVLPVFIQE